MTSLNPSVYLLTTINWLLWVVSGRATMSSANPFKPTQCLDCLWLSEVERGRWSRRREGETVSALSDWHQSQHGTNRYSPFKQHIELIFSIVDTICWAICVCSGALHFPVLRSEGLVRLIYYLSSHAWSLIQDSFKVFWYPRISFLYIFHFIPPFLLSWYTIYNGSETISQKCLELQFLSHLSSHLDFWDKQVVVTTNVCLPAWPVHGSSSSCFRRDIEWFQISHHQHLWNSWICWHCFTKNMPYRLHTNSFSITVQYIEHIWWDETLRSKFFLHNESFETHTSSPLVRLFPAPQTTSHY